MGYFVRDYLNNEYNVPIELIDYFEDLNNRAKDYTLDLADNYNAACEMFAYFKQFETVNVL